MALQIVLYFKHSDKFYLGHPFGMLLLIDCLAAELVHIKNIGDQDTSLYAKIACQLSHVLQ